MNNEEIIIELMRISKLTNKEICYEFQDLLDSNYNVCRKLLGEELAFLNTIEQFDDHYQLKFNYIIIDFYETYMNVRIDCIPDTKLVQANEDLPQFNFHFPEPDPKYAEWKSISFKNVLYICINPIKTILLYFLNN